MHETYQFLTHKLCWMKPDSENSDKKCIHFLDSGELNAILHLTFFKRLQGSTEVNIIIVTVWIHGSWNYHTSNKHLWIVRNTRIGIIHPWGKSADLSIRNAMLQVITARFAAGICQSVKKVCKLGFCGKVKGCSPFPLSELLGPVQFQRNWNVNVEQT